ncbi:MAG: ATP-binding protein [Gallionella sp.]|nr:ATP-binding protein [Gallionella sp.]
MHLSTRITLSIFLVPPLLMGLFGALTVNDERLALKSILHEQGNAIAQSIAAYSVEVLVSEDYPALEIALKTIAHESDSVKLVEVSQKGRVVARYGNAVLGNVLVSRADIMLYNTSREKQKLGEVKLLISEQDNEVIIAKRIKSMIIHMGIFVILFSLILHYILSRVVVKRIEKLKLLTEEVIATELSGRVDLSFLRKGSQDEIDVLHERFSSMLDGLQSRDQARIAMLTEIAAARSLLVDVTCAMPSALIVVTREGLISFCNSAAIGASENSAESMIGRPLRAAFPYSEDNVKVILDAVRKHKAINRLPMVKQEGGQTYFFEVAVYPLSSAVKGGAVIHIVDVTERVRVEEVMMQTNKMVSIGGLAAGVAHEINNPLGVMVQAAQNIERRVSESLETNHQAAMECGITVEAIRCYLEKRNVFAFLNDIKLDGERAAKIVRSLLEFSRNSESKYTPIRLETLFNQSIDLAQKDYDFNKNIDFRQIKIVIEVDPDLPPVPMVRSQIEQVLLNLLKNSAQALMDKIEMTAGGDFTPQITLRARLLADRVRIEVQDNGVGFSEDARRRAFEPFFTTKPIGSGTGLGLWIAYVIVVDKHGGEMTLESIPNKGCTFVVTLPLALGGAR